MAQLDMADVAYVGIQASELTALPVLEAAGLADIVQIHDDVRYRKQMALVRSGAFAFRTDSSCTKTNTGGEIEAVEKWLEVNRIYAQNDQCVNDYFQKFIIETVKNGAMSGDLTGVQVAEQVITMWARDRGLDVERLVWGGNEAAVSGDFGGSDAAVKAAFYATLDGLLIRVINAVLAGDITAPYTFGGTPDATTTLAAMQALWSAQRAAMRQVPAAQKILAVTPNLYDFYLNNREAVAVDLAWRLLQDGTEALFFRGIEVRPMNVWLQMQSELSWGSYLPTYLMILTTRDAMAVGTDAYSRETTVDAWYSRDDDKNYVRSKMPLGTVIVDEQMIHVAAYPTIASPSASASASPSASV